MVKICTNVPEVTKALKKYKNIPGSLTVNDKTYSISKVENIERKGLELIGRRFLGGLAIVFSLGILCLCIPKVIQELFQKTKQIRVTAILKPANTNLPKQEEKIDQDKPANQDLPKTETNLNQEPKEDLYSELPAEIRVHIESYLRINEFMQFSRVAKITQGTVQDRLDISDSRQREFIKLLSEYFSYNNGEIPRLMDTPKMLYPILIKLWQIIDRNQQSELVLLENLFTALKNKNHFNEESLLKLEPHQSEQVLEAVRPFIFTLKQYKDLYKRFASHATKMALVQDFLNDNYDRKDNVIKLYTNWSAELIKGVNLQNLKEKNDLYRLLTQLICFSHMTNYKTEQSACPVIDAQMPDITLTKLNNYSKGILNKLTKETDIRALRFIPTYAAWKAINLCRNLDGDQLRLEFKKLYLEGVNSSPGEMHLGLTLYWSGKSAWRKEFIYKLVKILLRTAQNEQEELIKKITHAIVGVSESLVHNFLMKLMPKIKQNNLMSVFLKKWSRVCQDVGFVPELDLVFSLIERKNQLIALIEEVKNFEEPRRSIYLRMLANVNDERFHNQVSHKEIREAFEECSVEIPIDGPVTRMELIQQLSPVSSFIKAIQKMQTRQDFVNVLRDLLELTEETKKIRLRVLLWGLPKFQLENIKKAFEDCDLNFDEFQPLPGEEFNALSRKFRSSLEDKNITKLVMQYRNNPYELRAIVYYCNSYLFFNPNIIPENERCAIFSDKGLNPEDYPEIYFQEWYEKEQKIHDKLKE